MERDFSSTATQNSCYHLSCGGRYADGFAMNIFAYGITLLFFLVLVLLLSASPANAAPAPFFGTDTAAGEAQFRSVVNDATASSAEFFEHHFTASTLAADLNPVAITGDHGTTVYVKISRAGVVQAYDDSVSHTHDGFSTYYFDAYSVSVASWAEAVVEGVTFEFFSDAGMTTPFTVNAFATFTHDWGTCCTGDNYTPTGSEAGSAVYSVFKAPDHSTSTNRIGNITTPIGSDVHFVAEIDDSNSFSSVTIVPNGSGEAFRIGGYLLFSLVGEGSIPAGSGWTPSVPPSVTFNPADGATGVSVGSNITLTFSEAVRNLDDTALTDANVDGLITLKQTNSSGADIAFDATINQTKTVITVNPAADLPSSQIVYVAIGATVEDANNNALSASNIAFTTAAEGVPTATFNPADGATGVSVAANITITFDEAVRNTDGSALTDANVDGLITLKQTNSSGADIAFDATISPDKMVITIDPVSNFTPNQDVYVQIASVEDDVGNETTATSATFSTAADIPPAVTTQAVSSILATSATANGTIADLGSPDPTQHGFCWNTTGTPTIADGKTEEGTTGSTGAFTSSLTGLLADTTYYVRAYATNDAGTSYAMKFPLRPAATAPAFLPAPRVRAQTAVMETAMELRTAVRQRLPRCPRQPATAI